MFPISMASCTIQSGRHADCLTAQIKGHCVVVWRGQEIRINVSCI
jgi:hypothetical protein